MYVCLPAVCDKMLSLSLRSRNIYITRKPQRLIHAYTHTKEYIFPCGCAQTYICIYIKVFERGQQVRGWRWLSSLLDRHHCLALQEVPLTRYRLSGIDNLVCAKFKCDCGIGYRMQIWMKLVGKFEEIESIQKNTMLIELILEPVVWWAQVKQMEYILRF